jgi:multidrug resistance protein, MATE family
MLQEPSESVVSSPRRGSARELLEIALPLVISAGSLSLMHVVDRIYLTWWSTDALAASLPAGILFWTAISLPMGIALYTNTFVAQYDGAGRKDRVVASLWQGIGLAVLAGIVLLGLLPFTEGLFALMGHEPQVQAYEVEYFSIMLWGAGATILAAVLSSFFAGRGQTRVVMYVNGFVALVNVGLDYALIFGIDGLLPAMGVRGAALATVFAQYASVGLFTVLLIRECRASGYPLWEQRRFDRELSGRMLWYGMPHGIQFVVDVAGFAIFIALVGTIGSRELAATNLAFNLNSLVFIPMMGMGTAVMTLVGRRIGERDPQLAVRTTWMAMAISGGYMLAFAPVYVLAPDLIIAPYFAYSASGELEQMRPMVVQLLYFVALYSFFDAMAVVFGSAVRGAGDTRFSLIFSLLAACLVLVLPVWLAWRSQTITLNYSWWIVSGYIMLLGVGFAIRFQQGRWKRMSVIEHEILDEVGEEAGDDPAAPTDDIDRDPDPQPQLAAV